jgi:mRNA interferase HicA
VKQKELVRWLAEQGATFTEGKEHLIAHLNGKKAPVPRSAKEIKTGTLQGILKRLGLK